MSVLIKRLKQTGTEFVPITADEAVVVNSDNIGLNLGITTLDKVLKAFLIVIGQVGLDSSQSIQSLLDQINELLDRKQNKLTPGTGISISDTGVISLSHNLDIYKVLQTLPNPPSADHLNVIYIVPNSNITNDEQGDLAINENNVCSEYICVSYQVGSETRYRWEKLGEWKADVDLSGYLTKTEAASTYVTKQEFNQYASGSATDIATNYVTTSEIYLYEIIDGNLLQTSSLASVSYDLPNNLYMKTITVNVE